jgi:hypothetical protein
MRPPRQDVRMFDPEILTDRGHVVAPGLIAPADCRSLSALWSERQRFRSHIVMQRHGYGRGEYQYFAYPLPEPIEALRQALYPALATVANRWNEQLGTARRFPPTLQDWLRECHAGGQRRPTPLLLRYGPGDYNCLHRDLYGELVFPLQVAVLLSEPGRDFEGGEFMLVEQRPRMQSRGEVVPLRQGDAVIFAVNERAAKGNRGYHRTALRHGVSSLRGGERFTLGIIFHDAA